MNEGPHPLAPSPKMEKHISGEGGFRSLPDGWRWAKLGEIVAEALPGFASGERDPKGVVQLRMNNVDTRGNISLADFIRVPADEAMIARYQLQIGDVMFNNTNSVELVGKTALFSG
ncbi:MAG TPA: hypothetical protein VMP08_17170, partial [Anaerolineae bacterium]|nr:hypothetical protein [Anaerolineae bacterium]